MDLTELRHDIGPQAQTPRPAGMVPIGGIGGDLQIVHRRAGRRQGGQSVGLGIDGVDIAGRTRPMSSLHRPQSHTRCSEDLSLGGMISILRANFEQCRVG